MKKNFKYFGIIWFVVFAVFNAIVFLVPAEIAGINRFKEPTFWIAYGFICFAFTVELIVSYIFSAKETNEKLFLNIPVLKVGYSALVLSAIVATIFMVVPVIPAWIGAIICIVVAVVYIIAGVKAHTAGEIVSRVGENVKENTQFMKMAVVDVENIMARSTTEEIKIEVKKVYDELKYSDYMSSPELKKEEVHIEDHIEQLKNGVVAEDLEMVQTEVNELLILIKERNTKCKALK